MTALNEHDLALRDFDKVLQLDPDNKAAKNKVALCLHQIKVNKEKEKKTFANMFDKVCLNIFSLREDVSSYRDFFRSIEDVFLNERNV